MAKKRNIFGFSIPELAIFMVILSTSMAGIVSMLPSQKIGQDIDITNNNMNKIETAILTFYHKNGFLPCPASRTLASDNVAYGVSTDCSANANGVTDITPNSKSIRIGVVPTRTLNLPDDVALDAWGSKISYAIVKELGIDLESFTTSNASSEDPFIINNSEGVKLNDFPTTLYTTHVLISHGKNKKGAYTNSGAMASICGNSGQDYENCNNNNTFVKGTLNKDLGSYYDDFFRWYTNSNLENMSGGAPTGCPAVPPEFTPSDIYGLRLWVDASDTSTIVKVPVLNTITSIADKSGNNLILTSLGLNLPTYNATGFNGKPTITMTNKNGLKLTSPEDLFSSQNSNFTFFFVGHQESTENENYLIDFEQDGWRFSLNLNMLGENFWYRQNTTLHSGSTHDGNVYASWVFNDGDDPEASLFINGNLVESNNSYNATTLNKSCINIGQACISGTPMDFSGEISEILMFNRALIPQERESVENYLKNKWGL